MGWSTTTTKLEWGRERERERERGGKRRRRRRGGCVWVVVAVGVYYELQRLLWITETLFFLVYLVALIRAVEVLRFASAKPLAWFAGLLGKQHSLDVGQYTTLSDGHTSKKLVEFFVVTYCKLKVTGDDPRFFVVSGSVASELQDFSSQVLQDSSHVHRCTAADPLCIVAFAEESVNTSHWKLETSTGWTRLCLGTGLPTFTSSRHDDCLRAKRSNGRSDGSWLEWFDHFLAPLYIPNVGIEVTGGRRHCANCPISGPPAIREYLPLLAVVYSSDTVCTSSLSLSLSLSPSLPRSVDLMSMIYISTPHDYTFFFYTCNVYWRFATQFL